MATAYRNALAELASVHHLDLRGASPEDIRVAEELLLEAIQQLADAARAEAAQYGPNSQWRQHYSEVARTQQAEAEHMRGLAANGWRTSWTRWFVGPTARLSGLY